MAEEKGVRFCDACGVSLPEGHGRQVGRVLLCENCHAQDTPAPGDKDADAVKTPLASAIMMLHILLGVISGLWLAIVGEWGAIGLGILFLVLSPILIGIALMPGMLSVPSGVYCMGKGKTFGLYCVASLTTLYRRRSYGLVLRHPLPLRKGCNSDQPDHPIALVIRNSHRAMGVLGFARRGFRL